jgi:uncharacterized delta-60 repeat protein
MVIRSRIVLAFALLMTLMIGASRQATAAPGSFDPTFGINGIFRDSLLYHSDFSLFPNAMVLQPDGKILVAGNLTKSPTAGNYVLLRRYNSDGSVDTHFGVDGFASQLGVGFNPAVGVATSVTVQLDGMIVVGGYTRLADSTSRITLWRFSANGFTDQSYGSGGSAVLAPTSWARAVAIAAYSTKIIVVATTHTNYADTVLLGRVNSNGTLDTTFKGGFMSVGSTSSGVSSGLYRVDGPRSLAVRNSNGDIYLSGRYFYQVTRLGLAKFDQNGNVSTGYGTNGVAFTPTTLPTSGCFPGGIGGFSVYDNVLLYPDGRAAVTGGLGDLANLAWESTFLSRYGADGSPDTTFNQTGFESGPCGNFGVQSSASLQSDGMIIFLQEHTTNSYAKPARVNIAGVIDTTYASTSVDFGDPSYLTIQPADNKVIRLGTFKSGRTQLQRIMLGRYLP